MRRELSISAYQLAVPIDFVSVVNWRYEQCVRSNYPGRDFEGTVADLAPTMATPRISARGPRRPSDIEVLEMTINLDGKVPLLPGMRVDAFVRPDR